MEGRARGRGLVGMETGVRPEGGQGLCQKEGWGTWAACVLAPAGWGLGGVCSC